jgi:WD40 repeat protein
VFSQTLDQRLRVASVGMLSNPWAYFSKHPFHLYDEDESSVQVTAIALCEVADIIAIATSNGRISFFNSEGEKHVTRNDIASKESYYCQLVWKPHGVKQLIGGRADGQVFSWVKDDHDGSQRAYIINNDHTVHKTMIRYLRWNDAKSSETERLLSIDHGGTCCIWKTDENELVPIAQIDSGVEINSFAILPEQFCIVSDKV